MAAPPPNAVHAETRADWRAWLQAHHATAESVWLISWKAATGRPRMSYDEVVEEAIAFGWVDSLPRALDAERTMLYVSRRKPGSGWSRLNKERVVRLVAAGRMTPAGQAAVDAAQADGSWSALDAVEALVVPADLADAFDQYAGAAGHWEAFPRSARRGILEWIGTAKRPETRARRVEETARLASENVRANQWPRR